MFCENCGKKLEENDQFCEHCGFEVKKTIIENKKSKPRRRIWKIALVLILLVLVGVGVWQFNHYFAVQKRSKVENQINELNNKIKDLDTLNKKNRAEADYYMERTIELGAEKIESESKAKSMLYQAPSSIPSMSTCHWIGSYYYCNYY